MYAVIRTGGKQYRVSEGDRLKVETLPGEVGGEVRLDEVLMVGSGDSVTVGAPLVGDASVTAEVLGHGRAKKIRIVKFKRRKTYRRINGHRQDFIKVRITDIKSS